MAGGYLRNNYTRAGGQAVTALGGGYPLTSYAGGAGLTRPCGGLVMGSISMSGVSAVSLGAQSAMSAWFGNTYESGYKIKIIAINPRIVSSGNLGVYASNISTSIIEFLPITSATLGYNGTVSGVYEWVGLITSAP